MDLNIANPALEQAFRRVVALLTGQGGRVYVVGGAVRDALMGVPASDLDLEVFGLQPQVVRALLERSFEIDVVGAAFGVIKIKHHRLDISLPRRESKAGLGHKAFDVLSDPFMSVEEGASRRDFTINAILLDASTGELVDSYHGARDLQQRVLRHTSAKFSEDPLRVLRAMQFAARFDFSVAPETVEICRAIEPEDLPRERVFEEWRKLIVRGRRPSSGLTFLRDCGWVKYYPELQALIGCPQDPNWHPEGDVWTHTLHCMDAFAAERTGDEREDLTVGLGVLCHDLGKPATTELIEGRLRSYGHEQAGEAPTRSFLARLTNEIDLIEAVVPLVLHHMRPAELYEGGASDNAVRRLAARVRRIDRLVRVASADRQGRPPLVIGEFRAGQWLLERATAEQIQSSAPKPIVLGRHLIELGLSPGPEFKPLLDSCYEAQLDGRITNLDEGLEFVRTRIKP